jgi:hypothetical protein
MDPITSLKASEDDFTVNEGGIAEAISLRVGSHCPVTQLQDNA